MSRKSIENTLKKFKQLLEERRDEIVKRAKQTLEEDMAVDASDLPAMAQHKLNRLQLHLTDDQGWRIEIKRHPELTRIGAWRASSTPNAGAPAGRCTGSFRQRNCQNWRCG